MRGSEMVELQLCTVSAMSHQPPLRAPESHRVAIVFFEASSKWCTSSSQDLGSAGSPISVCRLRLVRRGQERSEIAPAQLQTSDALALGLSTRRASPLEILRPPCRGAVFRACCCGRRGWDTDRR